MKHFIKSFAGLILSAFLFAGVMGGSALAGNGLPTSPPGQGECDRGNSTATCRPDPQPSHGADCEEHGPRDGGINEDHCASPTPEVTPTPTPEVTPSPTPTPEATPSVTPSERPSQKPRVRSSLPPTDMVSDVIAYTGVSLTGLVFVGLGALLITIAAVGYELRRIRR